MVTKFGGRILATKFGFVPDWSVYNVSNTELIPWTEMELHAATITQPEERIVKL